MNGNIRNERVARVLADSESNKIKCGVFILLIVVVIISYIVAIFAVPNTFMAIEEGEDCSNKEKAEHQFCHFSQNPTLWKGQITVKSSFSSIVNFWVIPKLKSPFDPNKAKDDDHDDSDDHDDHDDENKEIEVKFILNITEPNEKVISNQGEIKFNCIKGQTACSEEFVYVQGSLSKGVHSYSIEFKPEDHLIGQIDTLFISAYTLSPEFYRFLLIFRYVFLIISLLGTIFYIIRYWKIGINLRSFEHRFILMLSIAVLFFNDPLYELTLYTGNSFLAVLSTIFITGFLAVLILFWSIIFVKLKNYPDSFLRNDILPIYFIPAIVVFIVATISSLMAVFMLRFEPVLFRNYNSSPAITAFKIISVVLGIGLMMLYIWLVIKISRNNKNLRSRYYLLLMISLYFVAMTFIFFVTSFYHPFDSDGVKMTILIFLLNFYVLLLQILWGLPDFTCSQRTICVLSGDKGILDELDKEEVSVVRNREEQNNHFDNEPSFEDFEGNINFDSLNKQLDQSKKMKKELDEPMDDIADITDAGYEVLSDQEDNFGNKKDK